MIAETIRDFEKYKEYFDPSIMALDGVLISDAGDVVIPVQHFGLFPWVSVKIEECSLSSGGSPLKNYDVTINTFVHKDGKFHPLCKQYRWRIPDTLHALLVHHKDAGRNEVQSGLRKLLGVEQ